MNRGPLQEAVESARRTGLFTCASWAVFDRSVCETGATGVVGGRPVLDSTCFDLASLTKVLATTSLAHALSVRGGLDLDGSVSAVLREFPHGEVTFRHLLEHRSGLPAYLDLAGAVTSPEEAWSQIVSSPCRNRPGDVTDYSCLGFIVLGRAIEKLSAERLDTAFAVGVAGPLGLKETAFRSTLTPDGSVPPTSKAEAWRGLPSPWIQGIVHDPLAFVLGGVSGNAGLFGSARDVGRFGQTVLQGRAPLQTLGSEGWARRDDESRPRGLGWDFKSADGTSAGCTMSWKTFGHTGFTGTSLWIDPVARSGAALLTNAVLTLPDREALRRFRSTFCDLAAKAVAAQTS
ncbi:MAG: beta-lactamase family protein [Armatimonadetes bacterium]|nr:beta-lactamase family protein [Armatimonadota bacterium]